MVAVHLPVALAWWQMAQMRLQALQPEGLLTSLRADWLKEATAAGNPWAVGIHYAHALDA